MLTLCNACIGQIPSDDRWVLLSDSTIGNFKHKHLAKLTGTRVGLEVKRRECLWEVAKLNDIVSTYAVKSVSDSLAIAAKVKESGLCDAERLRAMEQWGKSEKRNNRLKTGLTVVFAVALVEGIIIAVK